MRTGKIGVSPSRLGMCPFRPFCANVRFTWYNCFDSTRRCRPQWDGEEIPKLVFAGSSPVARSMNFPTPPSGGVVRFLGRGYCFESERPLLGVSQGDGPLTH